MAKREVLDCDSCHKLGPCGACSFLIHLGSEFNGVEREAHVVQVDLCPGCIRAEFDHVYRQNSGLCPCSEDVLPDLCAGCLAPLLQQELQKLGELAAKDWHQQVMNGKRPPIGQRKDVIR